ncbi:MAG TPA: RDD family protein [Bryobacteraceae bacterium]|nr:RDD family protein [Bryobacteraceae bacterium]
MFCASCGATLNAGAPFCPNCGTPQPAPPSLGYGAAPQQAATPAAPGAAGYPAAFAAGYASWGSRAIGFIVDGLLIGIGMALLYLPLAGIVASLGTGVAGHSFGGGLCCMFIVLFPLATLLIGLYNGVYLIAQRGYSIGQGLVKVKVVDVNGNLLTQGTAFIRLLVRAALGFVPFLPLLDLLWPLWDQRGQTLHDKAVSCYVVNNPQGY